LAASPQVNAVGLGRQPSSRLFAACAGLALVSTGVCVDGHVIEPGSANELSHQNWLVTSS
jgi:hypothetical protein